MGKNKQRFDKKPKIIKGKKSFKGKGKGKGKGPKKNAFDVNARLVVRNLSFKTTDKSLRQHFEVYGKVAHITLPKRPNGDLVGCGFVQYENIEEATQGLAERNNQPFLGRSLQVDWAVSKDEFLKRQSETNKSDESNQDIATEPSNNVIGHESVGEKPDKPDFVKQQKTKKRQKFEDEHKNEANVKNKVVRKARLIVRNISFKATEETLKKHFEPYGEVEEVTLLKKPNGELIGCGFIQYKTVPMATTGMLETNAKPFLGRPIHVDWAVAKNKYMAYLTQKEDEIEYLKNDVKSEPESEDEKMDIKLDTTIDTDVKQESDDEENDTPDEDDDSQNSENENESDVDEKIKMEQEPSNANLKVSANDAEDGQTIFLKNVPFSVSNDDLLEFSNQFGEVVYALICVDKLTEHSKGSAFIRFKTKEDADVLLSSGPERMVLHDQTVQPFPALFRDRTKNDARVKTPKDSRNLYLVKEGLVLANTKAANGVSTTDMSKRLSLEQKKSQMLRNLNRFISRYRLTIHNIPPHYNDEDLRKVCFEMTNVKQYCIKECRVMKHLKGPLGSDGKHMSKGYGFITFTKHEDALTCLRRMNNNPSIFDKNNRPIVSFSIEDKSVINARNKRLEKSKIKNPLHASYKPEFNEDSKNSATQKNQQFSMRLKTNKFTSRNDSFESKRTNSNGKPWQNNAKKHVKHENSNSEIPEKRMGPAEEYMGETGKPGKQHKMRNRYKLQMQANIHRDNVKQEKKMNKFSNQKKTNVAKEKIKQPKQKQNTNLRKKMKKTIDLKDDKNFSDLVNKYKSKLVNNSSTQKVKTKWFEQS